MYFSVVIVPFLCASIFFILSRRVMKLFMYIVLEMKFDIYLRIFVWIKNS
jgi:hypothetical protein